MKKALIWGIPAIALIGLVIWRFIMVGESKGQVARQPRGSAPEVQVAAAVGRTIAQTLQGVGNIQSPQVIDISPKTAGRINYLVAREGDPVTPGEVLLKIDPSDLQGAMLQMQANLAESRARLSQAKISENATSVGVRSQIQLQKATLRSDKANMALAQQNLAAEVGTAQAQVTAAQSGVANAQAGLDKENANLRNAQVTYDRTLNLFKQNFIASQDVDNAKTALDVEKGSVAVAQAELQAAQAQLKVQQANLTIAKNKGQTDISAAKATVQETEANVRVAQANKSQRPAYQENLNALQSQVNAAQAQLVQSQARLADTIITSPIKGDVTARKADPGEVASPGVAVLEVQFLDWLYVTSTLPIDFSTQVHQGQIANITIDGLPGKTFSGPIININPAADPQSRQFGIKVRLDNKDHLVRPGMYGRLSLVTSQLFADAVVPKEAVLTDATGQSTVRVVDKSSVVHVRKVTLGVSDDKGVQVTSGVQAGEQVVVLSYSALKDGQKVAISTAVSTSSGPSVSVKVGAVKKSQ